MSPIKIIRASFYKNDRRPLESRWPTSHVTEERSRKLGAKRHEIIFLLFFFFFFSIGASLSGGRSLVCRCKENCCGDRKEARPVDINRGRGPVADATDELTPVDIKISLLFLTASSQTPPSFSSPFFFVHRLPRCHVVLLFHAIIASASRASPSPSAPHRIPSRLVFTGVFLSALREIIHVPIVAGTR